MRSGAVDHISTRRPLLFAMSKDKPKEENYVHVDPKVELSKEHEVSMIVSAADYTPFVEGLD